MGDNKSSNDMAYHSSSSSGAPYRCAFYYVPFCELVPRRPSVYLSFQGQGGTGGAGGECVVIRGRSDSGKFNL